MGRMGNGDTVALGELYAGFGDPIRSALLREFRRLGVTRVDADELDGLAVDVCTDLFARAGSWDPTFGVTPWWWARHRVAAIVGTYLGQFTDPLPEGGPAEEPGPPAPPTPTADGDDDDVLATLRRLGDADPRVRLLHEALDRVSRPAQQAVLLEVRLQTDQGDPSPSVTVGRVRHLKPDTVRQTHKRVTDRVRHLVATDPYFAPLAGLAFLCRAA
jgi:hypothetical protein